MSNYEFFFGFKRKSKSNNFIKFLKFFNLAEKNSFKFILNGFI